MSSRTVIFFLETCLVPTALVMVILGILIFLATVWIIIGRAILLTAGPAETSSTTLTYVEDGIETTSKNIITCGILETPTLTPGTKLSVSFGRHLEIIYEYMLNECRLYIHER